MWTKPKFVKDLHIAFKLTPVVAIELLLSCLHVGFYFSCRWVECPVIWLGRAILFFTSFQTVKVSGIPETADKAPLVCAAPHSSFFDSLVFFYLSGLPSGVSKEENKKVPIIAGIFSHMVAVC